VVGVLLVVGAVLAMFCTRRPIGMAAFGGPVVA